MAAPAHERQHLLHCALHATNSLLQGRGAAFTAADFNGIAAGLHAREAALGSAGWLNAHRSLLAPLGDWSVEVVAAALASRGLELQHFSPALPAHAPRAARAAGLLLNRSSRGLWAAALGARHWVALARVGGVWWDADSRLAAPRRLGALGDALALLAAEPAGTQCFTVCELPGEAAAQAPAAALAAAAPEAAAPAALEYTLAAEAAAQQ
jgi:josephin